jgi:hypothetical protein
LLQEEIVDVDAIPSQELKGHRMVMFHTLGDIDDPEFLLVVEQVIL